MNSRMDSGQLLLICAAGTLVVAAVAHTAANALVQPDVAVAFGVLIAVGELARLAMPGGREVAPIATAGALGYSLLLKIGDVVAVHGALQVVAVIAVGMIAGALPHLAVGRPPRMEAIARRILTMSLVAFAYRPLAYDLASESDWWVDLAIMVVLVATALFVDACVAAILRAEQVRTSMGVALWDELRVAVPLGTAVGVSGILLALAAYSMGWAALLVFAAPLLVTQVAFRKYAGIRATYLQTVRALSRVTEVGGYVEPGHSRRVSDIAVAVGRELGLAEADLLHLEYAALMHDIGQLALRDPIPGGATVLARPDQARSIAHHGAEVIAETGVLDHVAEVVSRQCDPVADDPPLASRIIKAANAYDDVVGGSTDKDRSAATLERLRLDGGVEYDPVVVEAMSKVIEFHPLK